MKSIFKIILTCLTLYACEDVIDVDVNNTSPRLVIDASINWKKNTPGNTQFIKLSLTAPFFDKNIPPATGASTFIADTKNNVFNFIEEGDTGIYRNANFIPEIDETYTLNIQYNNETYVATETLMSVVSIDSVKQKNDGGFSGEEIEIKAYYTDPKEAENYYLFHFFIVNKITSLLDVYDDEFINGNQIFAFYSDEFLESGDIIEITSSGISKKTFNFLEILLEQTGEDSGGGPFGAQPATIRGNCVNKTNPSNFPLGYFRLSETNTFTYTVE